MKTDRRKRINIRNIEKIGTKQWLNAQNRLRMGALKVMRSAEGLCTRRKWIITNIHEAMYSYEQILERILTDPNWKPHMLHEDFREIYWHTNLAYNARNATKRQMTKALEEDKKTLYKWVNHPKDMVFENPDKRGSRTRKRNRS